MRRSRRKEPLGLAWQPNPGGAARVRVLSLCGREGRSRAALPGSSSSLPARTRPAPSLYKPGARVQPRSSTSSGKSSLQAPSSILSPLSVCLILIRSSPPPFLLFLPSSSSLAPSRCCVEFFCLAGSLCPPSLPLCTADAGWICRRANAKKSS